MNEIRCKSPICIVIDGVRGRTFVPPENAKGVAQSWCPDCLLINKNLVLFSQQTAEMVRGIYVSYIETELPKEVKLILEQFTREIMTKLNEEL